MKANHQVRVMLIDGSIACLGTIIDLSLSGARIKIASPIEPGSKIDLIFDEHQQRFRCTVAWSTETEIGISFDLSTSRVLLSTADRPASRRHVNG